MRIRFDPDVNDQVGGKLTKDEKDAYLALCSQLTSRDPALDYPSITQQLMDYLRRDAVEKIADFFKDKVFPKVKRKNPELMVKLKKNIHSQKMDENFLYEEENEEDDDKKKSLKDRRSDRKEKAIIGGGLGVMATGMVASLGEFMGYSESDLTSMLHDINQMAGLGKYTGPVGFGWRRHLVDHPRGPRAGGEAIGDC